MISAVPAARAVATPRLCYRPLAMTSVLAAADVSALLLALIAGLAVWRWINPSVPPMRGSLLLVPFSGVVAFALLGLYPGIGLTAVQNIRRIWQGITLLYLLFTAGMFLTHEWWADSRGGFFLAWAFSLSLAPAARWLLGQVLGTRSWWGMPVMIIGVGATGRAVVRDLNENHALGYRPVVCVDDDPDKLGSAEGVPVAGALADVENFASAYGTPYAIVAIPGMGRERLMGYLNRWSLIFPKMLIVPNLAGVASLWTESRDLGGLLGLEVRQNLLNPWNQRVKRATDIVGAALGLLVSAPFLALCALWIRRSSCGPAIYTQPREGQNGRVIAIIKLRTMHPGAEGMLEDHLVTHPKARLEWERFCKLKQDPRILPGVGHLLRKTSLDELPQLWNVLKGEMSLVGPRPFPAYHNERFRADFRSLRLQVVPGLTGLWQVSARSNGDLAVQASLDGYYIRNWSLWLDLHILLRTVNAVLRQRGSY